MKILVACVDLIPQNVKRQPWYYMDSLVQYLTDRGHDVWILTNKETEWHDERKSIVIENFRSFPRGIVPQVGILIEKQGFDLIIWSTGLTDFFFKNKIDV